MSASLFVLSSSSWRPTRGRSCSLPRCPSSLLLIKSLRPPRLKPSSSPLLRGFPSGNPQGLAARAASDGRMGPEEVSAGDNEVGEARGQSTLPERFRHLTKEAPDRPVRWPWLIALAFLVYSWRAVLWELSNWKSAVLAIVRFIGYLSKLLLSPVVHFIGPPVTALICCLEFVLNFIRSIYSGIVAFTPVPELLWIIILASAVMAIAEASVPDSVSSQSYLLTAAGLLGYGAVGGAIPELVFWLVLIGIFSYSRFTKKRDAVSAALPPAAVLVAVGEPWVSGLAISSYLGLTIFQHSRCPKADAKAGRTLTGSTRARAPVPLQLAALAIGIHLAAKWVRYRHLTWMIV